MAKSPKATAWIPPNEKCPNPDEIGCNKEVLEDAIQNIIRKEAARSPQVKNLQKVKWDIIVPPVRLELITPRDRFEWQWPSEDWPCIQDFISHIRHRLDELLAPVIVESIIELDLASVGEQVWDTFIQPRIETAEGSLRLERERISGIEDISGLVGLERGTRARRDLESIAGLRLHRWSNDIVKSVVRQAREALRDG